MFIQKEDNEHDFSIGAMTFKLIKVNKDMFDVNVYLGGVYFDSFKQCCSSLSYMKTICVDYYWSKV